MVDMATVEALAPDQASLKAASKLTGRAKWPRLEESRGRGLVWGECQGSGANPYRTVADLSDHGTKCSCPSRKFPCKHALALLWLRAEAGDAFAEGAVPEWVEDWLGRRRKGAVAPKSDAPKDIRAATATEPADPAARAKAEARNRAAAEKRAADTARAIDGAVAELDAWLADQLRLGLLRFVDEAGPRCRAIAARLVDGKVPALAGRLDELPGRLLALRPEERLRAAVVELGALSLLVRAHRAAPDDPDVRQALRGAAPREAVLADPDAPRLSATWEVAGERVTTRRDGLVAQETWLLAVAAPDGAPMEGAPRFALLLDYTPHSAGPRATVFTAGETFAAELAFHPSRAPLRAVIAERGLGDVSSAAGWPAPEPDDVLGGHARHLARMPFAQAVPVVLPEGRVAGDAWHGGGTTLPLARAVPDALDGMALERMLALWDGFRLDPLAVRTAWGRIAP